MIAYIFYGKLKKHPEKIKNPFELLEWREEIKMGAWDFLKCADKYFGTRTPCDWGSFYWSCAKADLIKFSVEQKVKLSGLKLLSDKYGVVFIEMP